MKAQVIGYKNYGVLAYGKQPFFTINGPSPLAVVSEKVIFILPEGWKTAKNKAGTILIESNKGDVWVAEQILDNRPKCNGYPILNINGFKYYIEIEEIAEEAAAGKADEAIKNNPILDLIISQCSKRLQSSADYIKANLGAALDVIKHGGNLPDLDNIIHLEGLLHMHVSFELYDFIKQFFGDLILEINDPQSLMQFLTMYVTNVPAINL